MTEEYPVFHLTCITHRKDPIYAATIVGKPPMEDAWMGKAVERIFLPAMKMTIPEIVDVHLPVEGVFHNLMLVSIRKSYPGQARKVMNAIWALGQAMFTKCIVVVDEDCDVQNVAEVVLRVTNNIDPERDIQFTLGPIDSLDHASRLPNFGSKMGIDATRKWKAEGFDRPWPAMIEMDSSHQGQGRRALVETGAVRFAAAREASAISKSMRGFLFRFQLAGVLIACRVSQRHHRLAGPAGFVPLDGLPFTQGSVTSWSG